MAAHDPYAASDPYAPGDTGWDEPRRTSIAAVLSLVSALIFCIPLITQVLGLLFGVIGVISVSVSNGRRKGTGLAVAGIGVSLLVAVGWVLLFFLAALPFYQKLAGEAGRLAQSAIEKVESGSLDDVMTVASPALQAVLDERQIAAMRSRLQAEYGSVKSATIDWSLYKRFGQHIPSGNNNIIPAPMRIEFERGTACALAVFNVQQNPTSIQNALRIEQMMFESPDGSIWKFPFSAKELNEIESASTSPGAPDQIENAPPDDPSSNADDDDGGGGGG